MSLIRPELAERLHRWREPAVWGLTALVGAYWSVTGLAGSAWLLTLTGLLLAAVGAAFALGAVRRIRLADPVPAEGVVQIDEGRVGYFGPLGGAFIDVDNLDRVEITARFWRLSGVDGAQVNIPRGAAGAERLPDALSVLPGFTLGGKPLQRGGTRVMWERSVKVTPFRRIAPPRSPHRPG